MRGAAHCTDVSLRPESRGGTPLHKAAGKGHAACVEVLLKVGADKARVARPLPGWPREGVQGGVIISFKRQEGFGKQGFHRVCKGLLLRRPKCLNPS